MIARHAMLRALVLDRPADAFAFAFLGGAAIPAWIAIAWGVVWRLTA